jgi:hypothetical protein
LLDGKEEVKWQPSLQQIGPTAGRREHVTHYRAFATALEPAPIAGSRQQVMCGFYHKLLLDRAGPKLFFLFFFQFTDPTLFPISLKALLTILRNGGFIHNILIKTIVV